MMTQLVEKKKVEYSFQKKLSLLLHTFSNQHPIHAVNNVKSAAMQTNQKLP
jgi:hypothetical protein